MTELVPVYDDLNFHLSEITVANKQYAADMNYLGNNIFLLSGRRAKKPIHDGSQKNELNGYLIFNIIMTFCANTRTAKVLSLRMWVPMCSVLLCCFG
jgi:hypothetical protein